MEKKCAYCLSKIEKDSKQWQNQVYCTSKCRKNAHRKKTAANTRIEKKRANLTQNDEVVYLLKQCRRSKTVQILHGHDLNTFLETMELVRNRPNANVRLCHIAPVKGEKTVGLFHCKNLFYGGAYQNRKFGNRYFSGGMSIKTTELLAKWSVHNEMTNNEILILIEKYLGNIIPKYLEKSPVLKSKKVQIINKIIGINEREKFETLIQLSHQVLTETWAKLSHRKKSVWATQRESKYITYMDSLTRFIEYSNENSKALIKLRRTMVIAYMALERETKSSTYNKYFYVKYEPLVNIKYGQAMLINSNSWSELKDLIYETAFNTLQGAILDANKFHKRILSYLKFPDKIRLENNSIYASSFD